MKGHSSGDSVTSMVAETARRLARRWVGLRARLARRPVGAPDSPSIEPVDARPRALPIACRAAAFALLGGATSLLMMRHGIGVSPDGWAYWEGSVSILAGNGYSRFGAGSVGDWPPLFSLLLSLVQAVFGVSGATLIGTVAFLAAITTYVWCYVIFYLTHGGHRGNLAGYLAAAAVSIYTGTRFRVLLSETLMLPLLGVLFFLLVRRVDSPKSYSSTLRLLAMSLVMALMMLCRNSAIVFWPPVALIVLMEMRKSAASVKRKLAALLILLASVLLWYLVNTIMGLRGSQRLVAGGAYSPVELLRQMLLGLVSEFAPLAKGIGYPVAALVIVCLLIGAWRIADSRLVRRPLTYMATLGVLSLVGLFVLFNITIADPLNGRFLWHIPLLVITALGVLGTVQRRRSWTRIAMLGTLLVLLVCAGGRAYDSFKAPSHWGRLISPNYTIRTDYYGRQPDVIEGDHILIAPPEFEWLHRSPRP